MLQYIRKKSIREIIEERLARAENPDLETPNPSTYKELLRGSFNSSPILIKKLNNSNPGSAFSKTPTSISKLINKI
jgi:hypothetical protein